MPPTAVKAAVSAARTVRERHDRLSGADWPEDAAVARVSIRCPCACSALMQTYLK
jgi:hypothetical protein